MEMNRTHILKRPSATTPRFYETEGKSSTDELIVAAHYFMPATNIDYYVIEYDIDSDEIFCWGEVISGLGELGYTSLKELEKIEKRIPIKQNSEIIGYLPVRIEYDEYWKPKTLRQTLHERHQR